MYALFNRYLSAKALFIWAFEFVLISSSALLAIVLTINLMGSTTVSYEPFAVGILLLSLTYIAIFYLSDLFKPESYSVKWQTTVRIVRATIIVNVALSILFYYLQPINNWSWVLLANTAILPAAVIAWRTIFTELLKIKFPVKKILIIGSGALAETIGREVYRRSENGAELLGFIDNDPSKFGVSIVNPGVIGGYGDIAGAVTDNDVNRVIIALEDRRAKLPMSALLACRLKGVMIVEGETFLEALTGKISLERLKPNWLVFADGVKSLRSRKIFKRIFDHIVSVIAVVIAAPIMALTAILIKLESRGPVFTSQVRIGEQGKEFNMYQFRTMRHETELVTGPVWTMRNDDRITRVGKLIRKTGINKLPQLINILRGEMSFVGPRPERPLFIEHLKHVVPYYEVRTAVKPGVTGWAQVCYPYGTSVEDALGKLQFDVYYIKNMSPLLDIKVVFRTFMLVLRSLGAK